MTSRDPEMSNSCPQYVWSPVSKTAGDRDFVSKDHQ